MSNDQAKALSCAHIVMKEKLLKIEYASEEKVYVSYCRIAKP